MSKAIVLFSGGLDSTTCLYLAKSRHEEVIALSFNYGQKHAVELEYAKKIAEKNNLEHLLIKIESSIFLNSSLITPELPVPETKSEDVPSTYVPGRNTLFLSYAMSIAESRQATHIYLGASSVDYSGYRDCRPDYIHAFQSLINEACESKIILEAPLLLLSKAETIRLGLSLGVEYSNTVSCYQATKEKIACGKCDSCILRKKGFSEI